MTSSRGTLPSTITPEVWRAWDRAALARGMTLEELVICCVERELAREKFRRLSPGENGLRTRGEAAARP